MTSTGLRYALLAANAFVLGGIALTSARSQPPLQVHDVVRAHLFELVNDRGEMRAQLHIGEDGGGNLRLRSGAGEIRVKFGATDDGAILLMFDGDAEVGVRLARDESGSSLTLVGGDGAEQTFTP